MSLIGLLLAGGALAKVGQFYASAIKNSGAAHRCVLSLCLFNGCRALPCPCFVAYQMDAEHCRVLALLFIRVYSSCLGSGIEFDVLFGPAYKGIPLAAATSIAMFNMYGDDVPYTFNRKEAKVRHQLI